MSDNQVSSNALAMLSADIEQNIANAELGLGDKFLPVDAFRPVVQRIFNAVAYDYDCHRDKAVMAAMITVAGTVGKKATLVTGKYRNHAQLYGVLVDRPGGVKSVVNNYFLKPLEQLNRNAKDQWNRKKRDLLAENKDAVIPTPSIYLTKDVTPERLKQLLVSSRTGILEYHDELAGMFADFGKYSKNGSSDLEMRLSLYNGQLETPDRKGDEEFLVEPEDTSYSIYGTIQYKTLQQHFKPIVERQNGGFDRFMFVECPYHKLRHRSIAEEFTCDPADWKAIIKDLDNIPVDQEYILSQAALECYDKFDAENTDRLNEDPDGNDFMTQTLRRVGQNCLRLSLIIHLLNDWHEKEITVAEMDMAVRMMRVFCQNAQICYDKIYEGDKKPTKENTITLASQVRQYFIFAKMQGIPVNQRALANLFGCNPSYITKVKKSLIKEGLIDDETSNTINNVKEDSHTGNDSEYNGNVTITDKTTEEQGQSGEEEVSTSAVKETAFVKENKARTSSIATPSKDGVAKNLESGASVANNSPHRPPEEVSGTDSFIDSKGSKDISPTS